MNNNVNSAVSSIRIVEHIKRLPELLWVTLGYLVLTLSFFWPSLATGSVPLPLMNAYKVDAVWAAARPVDAAARENMLLQDVSHFYYPYLVFSIRSLANGQLPLWNPNIFGGIPYFAANQAALLYPINLLGFLFGPYHFWLVTALIRLVLAGVGTYLLARHLRVRPNGAVLAGVVYMFGSFNIVWLQYAIHNVAALLPLALWLLLRQIQRPTRRGIAALALLVCAQMLGGHPETSLFFLVVCVAVTLVAMTRSQNAMKRGAIIAAAMALGMALAAVQWLPTATLIQGSVTRHVRADTMAQAEASGNFSPLGGMNRASWSNARFWLLLVAPDMWGTSAGRSGGEWLQPVKTALWGNYNELASYVGLATLALAAAGIFGGRDRRMAWLFGAMLVLCVLLLYPLPALSWIGYFPPLQGADGFRFGFGITLAGAVLAGMGLDWVCSSTQRTRWLVPLLLLGLLGLNIAITADLWQGRHGAWALGFAPDADVQQRIASVYHLGNWRVLLPAASGMVALVALVARGRGWLSIRAASGLVVAAIACDLIIGKWDYNGNISPEYIFPQTPTIARLSSDPSPSRLIALDSAFAGNTSMTQNLQVYGGLDDLEPLSQQQFLRGTDAGVTQEPERHVLTTTSQRLLDLMNVRYLVSTHPVYERQGNTELPLQYQEHNVRVYANPTALPRAYALAHVVQVPAGTAAQAVLDPAFDPQRSAMLEHPIPIEQSSSAAVLVPVLVGEYTPNRVVLKPILATESVVVLADMFDPDWHVQVDGQEAPLLRANGMFRGVLVPAGAHEVMFTYWPRVVLYGGCVSGAALCAVALLLLPAQRRTRLVLIPT